MHLLYRSVSRPLGAVVLPRLHVISGGWQLKVWTRRRKTEVYPVLEAAERSGNLEEVAAEMARQMGRWPEEVLAVYRRTKRKLAQTPLKRG